MLLDLKTRYFLSKLRCLSADWRGRDQILLGPRAPGAELLHLPSVSCPRWPRRGAPPAPVPPPSSPAPLLRPPISSRRADSSGEAAAAVSLVGALAICRRRPGGDPHPPAPRSGTQRYGGGPSPSSARPSPAGSGPVPAPRGCSRFQGEGHPPHHHRRGRTPLGTAQPGRRFHDNPLPAPGALHPPSPQGGDHPRTATPPHPPRRLNPSRPAPARLTAPVGRIQLEAPEDLLGPLVRGRHGPAAPRADGAGPGWPGCAGLGGKAAVTAAPQDPPPTPPPSLPRTRHWPAQPTRAASRRPAPRPASPANHPLPPPRRPAFWRMKDGAAVHSDGAFAPSAPPPPHSRAAAQRSLRRTPWPSLTSPGDGSRRRTNLSRPLRSAVVRLGHGGARAGSGGGSGRPRRQRRRPGRGEGRGGLRGWGGVVEGARSPPRPGQHPADASPQGSGSERANAAWAVPELPELGWRFSSRGEEPSSSREFG